MNRDDRINLTILLAVLIWAALVFPAGSRIKDDAELGQAVRVMR
jgi:hypothetical protein